MNVLDLAHKWLHSRASDLESLGVNVSFTWGPRERDPAAAWLDFETKNGSARLMVWENGDAELMIGEFSTGEVVLEEHREIQTTVGLEDAEATILAHLLGK